MAPSQLTLNLAQGSVSFKFAPEAAKNLQTSLSQLMQSLKVATQAASGGGKPQPQKPMEYQFTGDVFLEVFCNPNIYPSPFAAKVLITVRDERIRLSTEAELTRLIEDVNQYLEQVG
ncbi:MAG TPA: hypothetical protein DDZ80_00875 [Cyanobacteria bacterium UBA8803]|nr:hypothetical protein [Cyanobacteria bacterium UBA9273]HBL57162.1 hypothetical protein [Cyanobacteria bacterium UBA8803]